LTKKIFSALKIQKIYGRLSTQALSHRVFRAGGWTLFSFVMSQVLRFASNLILTRVLFPEAFGLMAVVQAIMTGMAMLTDVGVEQSIIYNPKGNEPGFINTAWSIQIIRGLLISISACALAVPIAAVYHQEELVQLLPAVGLTALIGGFASTNISLAGRNLGLAKITILDISTTILSTAITIFAAWKTHSVWSLVIGSIVAAIIKTIASHLVLSGIPNRFFWDSTSARSLFKFGRWIFVSTALTFLVGEGNRLVIGSLLDVRSLAFYSLASALNLMPLVVMQQVGSRVLFPAYAEILRDRPEKLMGRMEKSRVVQIIPYWLLSVFFACFGSNLIHILYDARYQDSGWMLRILALGSLPQSVTASYGPILWAKGLVGTSTVLLAAQLLIQFVLMVIGSSIGGATGLLAALALTQWLLYPVNAIVLFRLKLWQPKVDVWVLSLSLPIAGFVIANLVMGNASR
jgi:O-antigen/teichoic acid export membrane protein